MLGYQIFTKCSHELYVHKLPEASPMFLSGVYRYLARGLQDLERESYQKRLGNLKKMWATYRVV